MSITLTTMRNFVEVAKLESFSLAAGQLYTAQSNLSKSISGLEESLDGTRLFYKDGRHVRLTEAGHYLYQEWTAILDHMEQSVQKTIEIGKGKKNEIKIGVLGGLTIGTPAAVALEMLKEKNPDLNITLERGGLHEIREKFQTSSYAAIATCEVHNQFGITLPDCTRNVMLTSCGVIAISNRHPIAKGGTLTISRLRDVKFVTMSQEVFPSAYRILREICLAAGFEPRVIRKVSSVEDLCLYVESGIGAAIVPDFIRLTENPNIQTLPLKELQFDLVIYYHTNECPVEMKEILDTVRLLQ